MRVLISGGGIAGLTLAYWLQHFHIPSVVIERSEGLRRDGYALDFFGTGYDVAERMNILEPLRVQQIPFDALAYVNTAGKVIAKLDIAFFRSIMDEKYLGLMHATLQSVLYEALAGKNEVRFACSLTRVVSGPDRVEVTFNNGTTESFDLLIGADGVHSQTRALVFGPEEHFSRYLGSMIACYSLADHYGLGHAWKMYLEPGRLAAAYCSAYEGEILTFFQYRAAKPVHLPRAQRLPHLHQIFAGMGWLTQRFLSDVPSSENIFLDAVMQIQMLTWHRGRVALLGDACGCPTLLSGQGASLAMGGAYLLAKALHETATYEEAFARYEQQMQSHVQAQQKSARRFATTFLPGTSWGLFFQQAVMKVILREQFRGLLKRQLGAPSILPLVESEHAFTGSEQAK